MYFPHQKQQNWPKVVWQEHHCLSIGEVDILGILTEIWCKNNTHTLHHFNLIFHIRTATTKTPYVILCTNATSTTTSARQDFEAITCIDLYKVLLGETWRQVIGNQYDICIFPNKNHKIGQM